METILIASTLTAEAYLRLEALSPVRHEFYEGKRHEMAGETVRHNQIVGNFSRIFEDNSPWWVVRESIRLHIPNRNVYFYPDVMLICENLNGLSVSTEAPVIIVEVLSESTEAIDRYFKWEFYRQLSTLNAYLLVRQDKAEIEIYERLNEDEWRYRVLTAEKSEMALSNPKIPLAIQTIYRRVEFSA